MKKLLALIEDFVVNIYLNMPSKISEDYVGICETFSAEVDRKHQNDGEILNWKNKVLVQMFEILQSSDYIKMADFLEYQLKPIILSDFIDEAESDQLQ